MNLKPQHLANSLMMAAEISQTLAAKGLIAPDKFTESTTVLAEYFNSLLVERLRQGKPIDMPK